MVSPRRTPCVITSYSIHYTKLYDVAALSGILALFNRNGDAVRREVFDSMVAAVPERAFHGSGSVILGAAALGHQHFQVLPEESQEYPPLTDETTGCAISADVIV